MATILLRVAAVVLMFTLAACGTRSSSEIITPAGATTGSTTFNVDNLTPEQLERAKGIEILEGRPERTFDVLAEISVTVSKNTAFDPTPTRAKAANQLRLEAVKLGADAVMEVVYDGPKVTLMSWGAIEANGKAIKFK